jgi:hypothetical protein
MSKFAFRPKTRKKQIGQPGTRANQDLAKKENGQKQKNMLNLPKHKNNKN